VNEPRVDRPTAVVAGPGAARNRAPARPPVEAGAAAPARPADPGRDAARPAASRPAAPAPGASSPAQATTALQARGTDPGSATTMIPAQKPPPEPAAPATSGVLGRWLSPALAVAAIALLPFAVSGTDLYALDGWGLAKVLAPAGWGALLCAVLACLVELRSRRPRIPMLAAATGVLILCSTGMPSVVEPAARFGTAWTTAGFVDAIVANNGVSPTGLDTRFWWPAFFAQWAWFREAAGVDQLDTILRWFPPVVVAVWATGIYALARSMLGGTRAPWVAAWLFVGLNWIEQDYFSPQAQAIVLLLTALTFALGPLATRRVDAAGVPGWPAPHPGATRLPLLRRWLVAARTPPNRPALPPRQLLLIYFSMTVCVLAVIVEHQLTPVALLGQLTLLAIVGRFRGRAVVLVGLTVFVLFLFVANRDWWTGNLGILIGTGDAGAAVQQGVADRLAGDAGQVFVKQLRVVLAGFTYLLGALGMLVYWRRRRDLVPFGLAVIPMAMAIQGYGSEAFLRIVLYGLPILVILGTDALRWLARRWRATEWVLAAAMFAAFFSVILVRGGNDAYQVVFPEEVAMYRQALAETPVDASILPINSAGPTGVEGITTHGRGKNVEGCQPLAAANAVDTAANVACVDRQYPETIVSYTSMEKLGVYLENRPPGWTLDLIQQLVSSGRYKLTYQDGFNAILKKAAVPNDPAPQAQQGGGRQPAPAAGAGSQG
jgi:hypothetical protein